MNIEQIKKAKIINSPSHGWVYFDNNLIGNEGFSPFEDINHYLSDVEDKPCFAWDCNIEKWAGINVDDVLENALHDWHEDAGANITDRDELDEFINKWNAKQDVRAYYPDYSRIIVLDADKFNQLIKNS